jgi:hypothetical protein
MAMSKIQAILDSKHRTLPAKKVIKSAILIFLFPRLMRNIKRNKPAEYNPLNLLDEILPALESVG